eukprot:2033295-Rhodomonas_salina.2
MDLAEISASVMNKRTSRLTSPAHARGDALLQLTACESRKIRWGEGSKDEMDRELSDRRSTDKSRERRPIGDWSERR